MSDQISRKQQFVRLRGSEHRRTQARLAQAQSDLTRLMDLSDRLGRLRMELAVSEGTSVGNDFRMMGEMAARLDLARAALDQPMRAATDLHSTLIRDTGVAAAREDAAARMLKRDMHRAAVETEQRRDAAHIHRQGGMRLRIVTGGVE